MDDRPLRDEPCVTNGIVARMLNLHPQTLRNYEQAGMIGPQRSDGNIRLYSEREVERLRTINRLTQEMGVNLAGVEIILRMTEQIEALQDEVAQLQGQLTNGASKSRR